jgi:hypothetical protein
MSQRFNQLTHSFTDVTDEVLPFGTESSLHSNLTSGSTSSEDTANVSRTIF